MVTLIFLMTFSVFPECLLLITGLNGIIENLFNVWKGLNIFFIDFKANQGVLKCRRSLN